LNLKIVGGSPRGFPYVIPLGIVGVPPYTFFFDDVVFYWCRAKMMIGKNGSITERIRPKE
jgi:hypothetical protein